MYSLQQFRDLVRTQLDTDSDDIPDVLVDAWVREGWRFCVNRNRRWSFYRSVWQVPVGAGEQFVDLGSVGSSGDSPLEIDGVSLVGAGPLQWLGWERIGELPDDSGAPRFWSVVGNQLTVFPVPSDAVVLQVSGFRQPVDWVADGGEATSDLPSEFDDVILNWSLGRAFQRQEDGDLGVMHLDQAEVLLRGLQRRWMRYQSSSPLVLNGGNRNAGERPVVWNV